MHVRIDGRCFALPFSSPFSTGANEGGEGGFSQVRKERGEKRGGGGQPTVAQRTERPGGVGGVRELESRLRKAPPPPLSRTEKEPPTCVCRSVGSGRCVLALLRGRMGVRGRRRRRREKNSKKPEEEEDGIAPRCLWTTGAI